MERVILYFVLAGGYQLAALLFWIGWKRPRSLRITVAIFAGAAVVAQSLVWHGLIRWGQAWSGGNGGVWLVWLLPIAIYLVLAAGLLMQDDDPLPLSSMEVKKLSPEEEYGPLR